METKENLLGILKTIFSWKKQILRICGIAVIGSILLSLVLPVYYESTTVFYAASNDLLKPKNKYKNRQLSYYGSKNDIERILTIGKSAGVLDAIIDEFDLYKHYKINKDNPKASFYVRDKFLSHYSIKKTKYGAIELTIEDKDKELAARMANAIRDKIDKLVKDVVKNNQQILITDYKADILGRQRLLAEIADSLKNLRQTYGIYSPGVQSKLYATSIAKTESKLISSRTKLDYYQKHNRRIFRDSVLFAKATIMGLESELTELNKKLELFNRGLTRVESYSTQQAQMRLALIDVQENLKNLEVAQTSDSPAVLLIEEAAVPVIKSRPRRTYIVIISTILAFVFSVIAILLLENYRDINWKEIINAKKNNT